MADNYSDLHTDLRDKSSESGLRDLSFINKYKNDTFVFDLKDYDSYRSSDAVKKVGINPMLSQEEMQKQFDANQSLTEAAQNVIHKTWNKTANSFVDFFKADFTTNQELMNQIGKEIADEQEFDKLHPSFDSRNDEERKSLTQWLPFTKGSGDFYEQFMPTFGYTIGMAAAAGLQNVAIGVLTGGIGEEASLANTAVKGKKIMDLITQFNTSARALKTLNTLKNGVDGVKAIKLGLEGYTMYSAFQSEAALEGAQTGKATYDKLVDDFVSVNGYMPSEKEKEEYRQRSKAAATTDYWMNAPILLASNFIQFSRLLSPTASRMAREAADVFKGRKIVGNILEGFSDEAADSFHTMWKTASKAEKVKMAAGLVGKAFSKDTMVEGIEESTQRLVSSFSQDLFTNDKENQQGDIWKATKYATSDMLSKEGLQEFIGGALMGLATHGASMVFDKTGLTDKFSKLTTGTTEEESLAARRGSIMNTLNNSTLKYAMKDGGVMDLMRNLLISKDGIKFNAENDPFNLKNNYSAGLYNAVWNAATNGKKDFIIDSLSKVGTAADTKWLADKLGVTEDQLNIGNLKEFTNHISSKIEDTSKNFKNVIDEFSKTNIEQDLLKKYDTQKNKAISFEKDLVAKYGAELFDANTWEKLTDQEKTEHNLNIKNTELSQLEVLAYRESVKIAAINYQTSFDTAKRAKNIQSELNSNSIGLNYTDAFSLLDVKSVRDALKVAKTSLELATEPQDKKTYNKQIEILEEVKNLHKEKDLNVEKIAALMHDFAKSNLKIYSPLDNNVEAEKLYRKENKQLLEDVVKLQQLSKASLNNYNFLGNANNFEIHRKHGFNQLKDFFEKVSVWHQQLQKEDVVEEKKPTTNQESNITETPAAPPQEGRTILSDEDKLNQIQEVLVKKGINTSLYDIRLVKLDNGDYDIDVNSSTELLPVTDGITSSIKSLVKPLLDSFKKEDEVLVKTKEIEQLEKDFIEKYTKREDEYDKNPQTLAQYNDYLDELEADDKIMRDLVEKFVPNYKTTEDYKKVFDRINERELIDETKEIETKEELDPTEDPIVDKTKNDTGTALNLDTILKTVTRESTDVTQENKKIIEVENITLNPTDKFAIYDKFLSQFKNLLSSNSTGLINRFLNQDNQEDVDYRLVLTKETPELRLNAEIESGFPYGIVLLVQTKNGTNEWKTAFFKENDTEALLEKEEGYKPVYFSVEKFISKKGEVNTEQLNLLATEKAKRDETTFEQEFEYFQGLFRNLQTLRQLAETEDQVVSFDTISDGIHINSHYSSTKESVTNSALDLLKGTTPEIIIAGRTDSSKENKVKEGNLITRRGRAVIKINDNVFPINPINISELKLPTEETLVSYLDNLMSLESNTDIIKHLSDFIFTTKNKRIFVKDEKTGKTILKKKIGEIFENSFQYDFSLEEALKNIPEGETIESITEKVKKDFTHNEYKNYNSISDYLLDEPLYLNISQKQLDKPELLTKEGKPSTTPFDYKTFITSNTKINGSFDENSNPIRVNKYITFSPILFKEEKTDVSSTENKVEPDNTTTDNENFTDADGLFSEKVDEDLMSNVFDTMDQNEVNYLESLVGKAGMEIVYKTANSKLWGQFILSGQVLLYGEVKKGTGYHESWHIFSQLFLTKEQKEKLYTKVKNELKEISVLRNGKRVTVPISEASYKDVEEYLAEDFKSYMFTGKSDLFASSAKKSFVKQLWDSFIKFINSLFNNPSIDIEKLYNDLRVQDLHTYKPSITNAYFNKLNSAFEGSSINNEQAIKHSRNLSCLTGQILTSELKNTSERFRKYEGITLISRNNIDNLLENPEIGDLLNEQLKLKYEQLLKDTKKKGIQNEIIDILNNWDNFIKFHNKYSKASFEETLDEEEASDENTEDAQAKDHIYDKSANEESPFFLGKDPVKRLLSLTPVCEYKVSVPEKYAIVYKDGLMELSNSQNLWNSLSPELNSELIPEKLIAKLADKELIRKIPEAGYIYQRLLPKISSDKTSKKWEIDVVNAFYQSFSKPHVPIISAIQDVRYDKDKKLTSVTWKLGQKTKTNRKALESKAFNNFQSFDKNSYFIKNKVVVLNSTIEKYLISKEGITEFRNELRSSDKTNNLSSIKGKLKLIEFLGYEINNNSLSAQDKIELQSDDMFKALTNILESIYNRVSVANENITNPTQDLKQDKVIYLNNEREVFKRETSALNLVLDFVSSVSLENATMSFLSSTGKTKYAIQQFNRLLRTNYWLSKTANISEILNSEGFDMRYFDATEFSTARGSVFMNLMFDKKGNRILSSDKQPIQTLIEAFDGYELETRTTNEEDVDIIDAENTSATETSKLNLRQKLIVDFNTFLTSGKISSLQNASKKSYYAISINSYNDKVLRDKQVLYVTPDMIESFSDGEKFAQHKFTEALTNYLEAELFQINKENYKKTLVYAKKSKATFNIFSFLSEKLKNKLIADSATNSDYFNVIENNREQFLKEILEHFNKKSKELDNLFHNLDVNFNESVHHELTDNYSRQTLLDAFTMNHFIVATEEVKLFRAQPMYYADGFFKRTGQDGSTWAVPMVNSTIQNFLYDTQKYELGSNFRKSEKTKERLVTSNFITVKDQIDTNHPITQTTHESLIDSEEALPKIVSDSLHSYLEHIKSTTGEEVKLTKELIEKFKTDLFPETAEGKHGKYGEVNISDGGGFCTMDFYRRFLLSVNNWSDAQEAAFRILSINYKLKTSKDLTQEQIDSLKKEILTYKKAAKGAVFNIVKVQTNTMMINEFGVEVPVLHKFSLFPLIPEEIKGKELQKIHESMLKEDVDYHPFKSSSKAYIGPNITDLLSNEKTRVKIDSTGLSSVGEQLLTASKFKSGKRLGVQQVQLAFANMFSNGVPIGFKGTHEDFVKAAYADLPKIGKIYRDNESAFQSLRDLNKQELLQDLGVTETKTGEFEFNNLQKFIKKLHSLADERGANINIKDYISYDEKTNSFTNPLDFSLNVDEIKRMINGLIDKKTRRMTVNGALMVQRPDYGQQSFTNPTESQLLKYGTNGLPFYYLKKNAKGEVILSKMGIKITMNGSYSNLLNIKEVVDYSKQYNLSKLDALNELLQNESFREEHEEALTIVGYRIPTQGPNSMDVMVVHEFLPEECGNTIILPAGVTTKSGSDYDIDKLNLFFKSLDKQGKVISELSSEEESKLLEKNKSLKEFLKENEETFKTLEKDNKKILSELKQYITEVISNSHQTNTIEELEQDLENNIKDLPELEKYFSILKELSDIKLKLNKRSWFENKLTKSYEEILSQPEMFYQLVKPNNTDKLDEVIDNIHAATGRNIKKFEMDQVYNYLSSLYMHDELQEGKRLLSMFATNTKFFIQLINSGMKINNIFSSRLNDEGEVIQTKITNPLLPVINNQTSKENLTYDISNSLVNKETAFDVMSEYVNITVDIEGKPIARVLGLNSYNVGAVTYLTIKRNDTAQIWNFLNQPILRELYKKLDVKGIKNENSVIIDLILNNFSDILGTKSEEKLIEMKQKNPKGIVSYLQAVNQSIHSFSSSELKDNIKFSSVQSLISDKSKTNNEAIIQDAKKNQFNILVHYISINEEAKRLQLLRRNTSYESNKIEGILQIAAYDDLEDKIKNSFTTKDETLPQFFPNTEDYYNTSFAYKYKETPLIKAIHSKLFPITSDKYLIDKLTQEGSKFTPNKNVWNDLLKSKAEKVILNDFIASLIQNFGLSKNNIVPNSVVIGKESGDIYYVVAELEDGKIQIANKALDDSAGYFDEISKKWIANPTDIKGRVSQNDPGFKAIIVDLDSVYFIDKEKLSTLAAPLLKGYYAIDSLGNKTLIEPLAKQIQNLKNTNPELVAEFPILKKLVLDPSTRLENIEKDARYGNLSWNVQLNRGEANDKEDKDNYIAQFKELTQHSDPYIAKMFQDLMKLALYQSGFNNSPYYFTDVLDYSVILPMINQSYNIYQSLPIDYKHDMIDYLLTMVKYNNPKFYRANKKTGETFNRKYIKGKNLSIDLYDVVNFPVQKSHHDVIMKIITDVFQEKNSEKADEILNKLSSTEIREQMAYDYGVPMDANAEFIKENIKEIQDLVNTINIERENFVTENWNGVYDKFSTEEYVPEEEDFSTPFVEQKQDYTIEDYNYETYGKVLNPTHSINNLENVTSNKEITRNLVELQNRITDFETNVQKLFNNPTVELYEEIVGNYEYDLSADISDSLKKDIESKLQDVKNSFTIKSSIKNLEDIFKKLQSITPEQAREQEIKCNKQ